MKVELLTCTPDALALLLYTKNTRLAGKASLEEVAAWPEERKLEELAYMRDTIKSSWEFVDYTFQISGVSRAFTHQLVRTRTGHYAQESQRVVDFSEHSSWTPGFSSITQEQLYNESIGESIEHYHSLLDSGMAYGDARGVLPTAMHTSIIAKFSLRTLHEMAIVRLCTRTAGEYQDVFRAMKREVMKVHPWADDFIQVGCVNNGVCVFPRHTECPIYPFTYNATKHLHDTHKARVKHAYETLPRTEFKKGKEQ